MTETAESSVYGVMASWFTPSCLFLFINLVIGIIAINSRLANTTKRQHQLVRSPSLLERLASFNLCYHKKYEPTTTTTTPIHSVVDPVQSRDESRLNRVRSFNQDFCNVDNIERPDPVQNSDSPQLDRVPSSSLLYQVKSSNLNIYKPEIERPDLIHRPNSPRLERPDLIHRPNSPRLGRVPSISLLDRVRSFNLSFNKVEIKKSGLVQQQLTCAPSILERLKSSLSFDRLMSATEPESEVTGGEESVEETEEEGVDAKADDFINRFRQQLRLQRLDSIIRYRDMLKRH